jgi:transcriptional regulator with XRE-family HTH domain
MILADKIIQLRKRFGWSQENLAEALEVSRQSVSKWESGNSIPDLNKILKMAEIFSVSTDYLLKDDLEQVDIIPSDQEANVVRLSMEEVNRYVLEKERSTNLVSRGVLLCIYGLLPLFLMLGLTESSTISIGEDTASVIGVSFLLLLVASGITLMIISNPRNIPLEKLDAAFELSYGVEGVYREKLQQYLPSYSRSVALAIVLLIFSVIPVLLAGMVSDSDALLYFMLDFMVLIAGAAIFMLIRVNAKKNVYEVILKLGEFTPEKIKENKRIEKLAAVYWPLVVAIYLGWSFLKNGWYISWIVWPIAGLLFGSLVGLIQMIFPEKKGKHF